MCGKDGWVSGGTYKAVLQDPGCKGKASRFSCSWDGMHCDGGICMTARCETAAKDVCHRQDPAIDNVTRHSTLMELELLSVGSVQYSSGTGAYAQRVREQCCRDGDAAAAHTAGKTPKYNGDNTNAPDAGAHGGDAVGTAMIRWLTSGTGVVFLVCVCGLPALGCCAGSSFWRRTECCNCFTAEAEVDFIRCNVRGFQTELFDVSDVVGGVVLGTIIHDASTPPCPILDSSPVSGAGGGSVAATQARRGVVVFRQEQKSNESSGVGGVGGDFDDDI